MGRSAGIDFQAADSRLARRATELVRRSSPEFLTDHCFRSYVWSVALAGRDEVRGFAALIVDQAARKPSCWAARVERDPREGY